MGALHKTSVKKNIRRSKDKQRRRISLLLRTDDEIEYSHYLKRVKVEGAQISWNRNKEDKAHVKFGIQPIVAKFSKTPVTLTQLNH